MRRIRSRIVRALLTVVPPVLLLFSPAAAAQDLPEWVVDPDPSLEAGVIEGSEDEMFVDAWDAAFLPDGGVVVLDRGGFELRFFDASGALVAVSGRDGEGPGEFKGPFRVEVVGDSVMVWDYPRALLSLWSTEGEHLGERRVDHHRTFHEGELLPDGSLIIPYYAQSAGNRPASGRYRPEATLLRYVGEERMDLGPFPYHEMVAGGLPISTPYASRSVAAGGGSPFRVYVADDTNLPRVREYDTNGRQLGMLELLDTREGVSRRRWDAVVDSLAGLTGPQSEPAIRRALDEWGRPEFTPAFEELLVDAEGRLWVLSQSEDEGRFAIVYQGGEPIARVDVPPVEKIFEIGSDRLAALVLGPFDVHMVHVFRFGPR